MRGVNVVKAAHWEVEGRQEVVLDQSTYLGGDEGALGGDTDSQDGWDNDDFEEAKDEEHQGMVIPDVTIIAEWETGGWEGFRF